MKKGETSWPRLSQHTTAGVAWLTRIEINTSQIAIRISDSYDVLSLGTLLALGDCELHFLAFSQGFEA